MIDFYDEINIEIEGYSEKIKVNQLQEEIIDILRKEGKFKISRIFELLPIKSPHQDLIKSRGSFNFEGNRATNKFNYPFEAFFFEEALGEILIEFPAEIKIDFESIGDSLILYFDDSNTKIIAQIEKVYKEGIDRSSLQLVSKMIFHKDYFITSLTDYNNSNKKANLIVKLNPNKEINFENTTGNSITLNTEKLSFLSLIGCRFRIEGDKVEPDIRGYGTHCVYVKRDPVSNSFQHCMVECRCDKRKNIPKDYEMSREFDYCPDAEKYCEELKNKN